jgi:hypothetical protein
MVIYQLVQANWEARRVGLRLAAANESNSDEKFSICINLKSLTEIKDGMNVEENFTPLLQSIIESKALEFVSINQGQSRPYDPFEDANPRIVRMFLDALIQRRSPLVELELQRFTKVYFPYVVELASCTACLKLGYFVDFPLVAAGTGSSGAVVAAGNSRTIDLPRTITTLKHLAVEHCIIDSTLSKAFEALLQANAIDTLSFDSGIFRNRETKEIFMTSLKQQTSIRKLDLRFFSLPPIVTLEDIMKVESFKKIVLHQCNKFAQPDFDAFCNTAFCDTGTLCRLKSLNLQRVLLDQFQTVIKVLPLAAWKIKRLKIALAHSVQFSPALQTEFLESFLLNGKITSVVITKSALTKREATLPIYSDSFHRGIKYLCRRNKGFRTWRKKINKDGILLLHPTVPKVFAKTAAPLPTNIFADLVYSTLLHQSPSPNQVQLFQADKIQKIKDSEKKQTNRKDTI